MGHPLKIIFAGTPDFAAIHLQGILAQAEHEVIAVYSQPDRPAGRGKKLKPSAVKQVALDNNIPVYQPLNFKETADQQTLQALNADLMVVVAYGLLLPKVILDAPRLGCINVHASLLPRWRGAAPIQRAIEAGDSESGVIIMQMDEGLDTGDMLLEARCDISAEDTGGSLHDKLADIGVPALNSALQQIAAQTISATQQDHEQTCYAPKISKRELAIDWQQAASVIQRKIRAFNPFPIAYTSLNGERIKIWQTSLSDSSGQAGQIIHADKKSIIVACGEGSLKLDVIQLPGGKALEIPAVMNSKAELFTTGTCFDQIEIT
ncbi:methionyl-tRNA formyltransferase [Oceanicoccus sagamiensis]|uniref:Methionyl-tRNA formyltransferase n=1 Tax=Oceanicoccus sagamiensis TaxID=716816 RepID=A0A1X9N8P8_9GAMM|nr:methionyl-tRNA formyltransferase [Oceanicoccus sagamiensis]ARN74046.1 methionyl-tRNA formyltransferase [Oceanicoccus sagamiensis]